MADLLEKSDTAIPTADESEMAKHASRALAARGERELRVRLDDDSELILPKSATRLIQHLLLEMSHGNAVTLIPIHAELTTQEAADLLGVSRPFLIKLRAPKKFLYERGEPIGESDSAIWSSTRWRSRLGGSSSCKS